MNFKSSAYYVVDLVAFDLVVAVVVVDFVADLVFDVVVSRDAVAAVFIFVL